MRLHHLAIQVTDLERAKAFYSGLLGLAEIRRQAHSIWLDAGGVILMLERCLGEGNPPPWKSERAGLHLCAFAVAPAERAALRARLTAADVAIEAESAFTTYFRDPDGNRLGLSHYPEPAI